MNHFFFLLTISVLLSLYSCTEKETVIAGKIIGNADKLVYSNPNNGTCNAAFRDTIYVDENGNFELKFQLKEAAFIDIWTSDARKDVNPDYSSR